MSNKQEHTDVILIGAGMMSATLGSLLHELAPDWNVKLFEKLTMSGEESSNEWNNAGTGHSALCELNYTPEQEDGSVEIKKAVNINEQFQVSKQYWTYLVKNGVLKDPKDFIMPIPHMSFVEGKENVSYLKKRHEALSEHPLFQGMEYSENLEKLSEWIPLMTKDRKQEEPIAATKTDDGTDVNFGALTRELLDYLEERNVDMNYSSVVKSIKQRDDGLWEVKVHHLIGNKTKTYTANFVFIGAGGGSLPLLQKTGIPESKKVGGFPVGGLFLVCNNPDVIEQHHAKVYGKAKVGAPPMSVPHLDTRFIGNERTLLFGPFAGFSPKFLKTGSNMDLIGSVKPNNVMTMLAAGAKEMGLTKYLIEQLLLSEEERMDELREFIPDAKDEDWHIVVAGQRVQVIKDTDAGKGTLQFGTEVVKSSDGTIAALLGASPGASTAVHVMLGILKDCFPEEHDKWLPKIKEMVPSYGKKLSDHPELFKEVHAEAAETLELNKVLPTDAD